MANQLDLVDGQRVEDPDQVCDQAGQRIIAGSSRHIAVPATAGVRRYDPVPCSSQRRDLIAPDSVIVREPVYEQHRLSNALIKDVERQTIDPEPVLQASSPQEPNAVRSAAPPSGSMQMKLGLPSSIAAAGMFELDEQT